MIRMFHVYKSYMKDTMALSDINLNVEKGEFVFVTGPSGAGKTTLLKLIFCGEYPTSGQILVDNLNISKIPRRRIPHLRRSIGVVFQDFKLIMSRTVFDNVALALEVAGRSAGETEKRVNLALKNIGLAAKKNSYPIRLSGGEQQRVAIARATVNEPKILLADEPTGNLDPDLANEVLRFFQDLNAKGTTIVFATHDKAIIETYKKRTVYLESGRIVKIS